MPIVQTKNLRAFSVPRLMMTATAMSLCLILGAHTARAEEVAAPAHEKPKVLFVPLAVMMAPGAITAPPVVSAPSVVDLVETMHAEMLPVTDMPPPAAAPDMSARPSLQIIEMGGSTPDLLAAAAPRPPLVYSDEVPVMIDADHLSYDDVAKTVTATGNVEVKQSDKILRADQIVYNQNTDTVAATGNVTLLDNRGDVHYA